MENGAEPQSWLPDGTAPAVAADVEQSADGVTEAAETSVDLDPVTYGESGSYVYEDQAPDAEAGAATDRRQSSADAAQAATAGASPWSVRPAQGASAAPSYETPANGQHATAQPGSGDHGSSTVGAYAGAAGGFTRGTAGGSGYESAMTPSADEVPPKPGYESSSPRRPYSPQAPYGAGGASAAGGVYGARTSAGAQTAKMRGTGGRRANLVISRLEPWSVMKFSFLMSLVAWVVLFVAVAVLYYALSGLGVFSALGKTLSSVTSSQGSSGASISNWTSASRVLGYTMLIGAIDVVVITAMSTIGAMIYNLVSHLGGGIEVTFKEAD